MALPNFDYLKGAQCKRFGCLGTAGYVPVLRLYAPNAPEGSFAEMAFAIPLCGNCAGEVSVADLLNEADWHLIETSIKRNNAPPPDRARTEITWLPLFDLTLPATELPPELKK